MPLIKCYLNGNLGGHTWHNKALFTTCFRHSGETCPQTLSFRINKTFFFVGIVNQEQWLNAAPRVGLCPSKQTLWANQLISATPEEEWRRYQALADGPPWSLGQGL